MNARPHVVLLMVPALAVALGAFVAHRNAVPLVAFVPNAAAILLGIVLARFVPLRARIGPSPVGMVAAVSLMGATLAFGGMEGVRRWLPLGPIAINVSAVVAPYLLGVVATTRKRALLVTVLVSAIHVLQPDAGQATAFGLGAATVFVVASDAGRAARAFGAIVALAGIAAAWWRRDALAPVDHVERIVHLAFGTHVFFGVGALVLLAILALPFARAAMRTGDTARIGAACAVYFVASIAVTVLGSFPVPVLGAGASPVLGWFVLLRVLRASRDEASRPSAGVAQDLAR